MLEWPRPICVRSLKGFLGLTGYYKKFIRNYGIIVAPITKLLRKNTFLWSTKASEAFEKLKLVVTNPLVLKLPDFSLRFTIECNVCGLV